jgi:hypothetical protein
MYIYTYTHIHTHIYQSPSFKNEPGKTWDLRRRTEIIPAKDSYTRIKPLALASGDIIVFQGGDDGRGYRNMCKIPRGSDLNEGD